MTREEAITLIKAALKTMYLPKSKEYVSDLGYALEIAIKALEQDPCEDAISRTEVIKSIDEREDMNGKVDAESVRTDIVLLPPVTPQPKWIPVSERLPQYGKEVLTCSNGGFIEIQSREGTYGYWENQHGDWSVADEVIAWMPLPKPYEPKERSDKE